MCSPNTNKVISLVAVMAARVWLGIDVVVMIEISVRWMS